MSGDAVRRYKELADLNSESVRRMREHDHVLAEQLRAKLATTEQALAQALQREKMARAGVRLHWEAAVEELWNARWLAVPPLRPPVDVPPDLDLTTADIEVGRTYEVLLDALRHQGLLTKRH